MNNILKRNPISEWCCSKIKIKNCGFLAFFRRCCRRSCFVLWNIHSFYYYNHTTHNGKTAIILLSKRFYYIPHTHRFLSTECTSQRWRRKHEMCKIRFISHFIFFLCKAIYQYYDCIENWFFIFIILSWFFSSILNGSIWKRYTWSVVRTGNLCLERKGSIVADFGYLEGFMTGLSRSWSKTASEKSNFDSSFMWIDGWDSRRESLLFGVVMH